MTTQTPDQAKIQTNDSFLREEPVAGLATTTVIDTPTYEDSSKVIYQGSDAAEIFYIKNARGSSIRPEVRALGGDDEVYGSNIADRVFAGNGNDRVFGNSGNDTLYGDSGNDLIFGDSGKDYLDGGSGKDILDGGLGNDRLFGGVGEDRLTGGAGKDVLNGGDGNDRLTGGVDADAFVWSDGSDTITDFRIENGDIIFVLDTSKVIIGESGSDVILFPAPSGSLDLGGASMVIKNATLSDVSASIMDDDYLAQWQNSAYFA